MRRIDVVAGSLLAALGLVTILVIVPAQISGSSAYGIAPDVFPLTLLWLLVGLSLLLALLPLAGRGVPQPSPMQRGDWLFLAGAAAFLAGAYAAVALLGMRIGGALILAGLMGLMGEWRHHKLRVALLSLLTPLILYSLFWNVFRIPLP